MPVVLALGTAQTLAWGSTYYLPAILAQSQARDLGCSTTWIFGAFSAALVLSAGVGPLAGRFIDRHGGRGLLAATNLIFAAGLTLVALADGFWGLVAGWLIIGMGMGMGLYEGAFAALTALYGRAARGPITGITLLAGFASTICWPLSAVMEAHWGWRATCLVWAGAHLAMGWPLNRFGIPGLDGVATPASAVRSETPVVAAPRTLFVLAVVFAATWFTSTAMAAHLPMLLQLVGASVPTAVAAAALVGSAQVLARLVEASLLQRQHPLFSARLACAAHPVGALALLGCGAVAAVPFALLHGAGNGILTVAKGTLPLALFGPVGYGLRQGLLMVPARIAQAAAPLLFGWLIVEYGAAALWCSAGIGAIAWLALVVGIRQQAGTENGA